MIDNVVIALQASTTSDCSCTPSQVRDALARALPPNVSLRTFDGAGQLFSAMLETVEPARAAAADDDGSGETNVAASRSPGIPRQFPVADGVTARLFVDPTRRRAATDETARRTVANAKVFVVGAGGIGCELLKDLVLGGWRHIEVIDLDTIDATNLNRQFLFRPCDVGGAKSTVAAERVLAWARAIDEQQHQQQENSLCGDDQHAQQQLHIEAYHGNVKDATFNVDFFKRFSVVINGLDNVSARKHVNRLCIDAGVPLVESGTMGYNGQAQPIVRGRFECYDCHPKSTEQKTFAVCTIHSRPSTIVHCVHYARELYARLFGDSVSGASEFDFLSEALAGTTASGSSNADAEFARLLADMVFNIKIRQLIELRSTTTTTTNAGDNSSNAGTSTTTTSTVNAVPIDVNDFAARHQAQALAAPGDDDAEPTSDALLAQLFAAVAGCRARDRVPFDKNDDVAVAFIASVANLRAAIFGIGRKSSFEIRTIAGNIIPAIASTNAAVAAAAVHLATQLVVSGDSGSGDGPQFVAMRQHPTLRKRVLKLAVDPAASSAADAAAAVPQPSKSKKPRGVGPVVWERVSVSSFACGAPNASCIVCRESRNNILQVRLNAAEQTLGDFVRRFLMAQMSLVSPCVHTSSGTVYEHEDFESHAGDLMSRFVSPSRPRCSFEVDDFSQSVEWTVEVVHDESLDADTPFAHTVVSRAAAAATATATSTATAATSAPAAAGGGAAATSAAAAKDAADEDDRDEVIFYHPKLQHRASNNSASPPRAGSLQQPQLSGHTRQREEGSVGGGGRPPRNEVEEIVID